MAFMAGVSMGAAGGWQAASSMLQARAGSAKASMAAMPVGPGVQSCGDLAGVHVKHNPGIACRKVGHGQAPDTNRDPHR
jgi:hypothetical protein